MTWKEVLKANGGMKPHKLITIAGQKYLFVSPRAAYPFFANHPVLGDRTGRKQRESGIKTMTQAEILEKHREVLKGGDNFAREKKEGLHGWFSRRGGKQTKGGKTQGGWIACGTCKQKGGPKPCGRADASKGKKRRCRPTCAACKTYKRRKGA